MRYVKWLVLWVIVFMVTAFLIGSHCFEYYRLMKSGKATTGVVVARVAHMQLDYSFTVGGRTYANVGIGGAAEHASPGNSVPVTYLPESPEISCIGDAAPHFSNELVPVLGGSIAVPTFMLIALAIKFGSKRDLF